MSSDLLTIFLLSLAAMFNPTLLAAVTLMLLLPSPKRLLLGYLLGAYITSITVGLVIVFALPASGTENTSKHTIGPIEDLVIGLVLVTVAFVLRTDRDKPFRERRMERKEAKLQARRDAGKPTQSLPLRLIGKGDPRITFLVGMMLSFPGVSYLLALDHMRQLNAGDAAIVLLVICFCVTQQLFLELPLVGYLLAPARTQRAVARFRAWMERSGRGAVVILATVLGIWLLVRGVLTLL